MQLVECVPNFSEGRDPKVIKTITDAIAAVSGVTLLDVDPGADTNRTVVTFVGEPEAVLEAAFAGIETAARVIDMQKHHGAHPRMGATDVCPFVPVSDVSMQDCVALARRLGERVGRELGIWVYLYEQAASRPAWANLAEVRKGEYQGLKSREGQAAWKPDFGPETLNARAGATAIGAREFLIAYNVNLNTRSKALAHDIALDLREQGRSKRGDDGKFVRDEQGHKVPVPGLFKKVKAVGWYIEEYARAQISMNLTDYHVSPMHEVFDKACELAWQRGMRVTGSELVGLLPKQAMLDAGRHFLRRQGQNTGRSEARLIEAAVQSLGLNDLGVFEPREKIIEYRLGLDDGPLVTMSGRDFVETLASAAPAPGGGSIAAMANAFAAGLDAMVADLTFGKKGYTDHDARMQALGEQAHQIKEQMLSAVDADTAAFDAVMAAMRLPKKTEAEQQTRDAAMQSANLHAAQVPLETLRASLKPITLAAELVEKGNQNSLSDAGVAALMAGAGAEAAYYNVLINLPAIDDPAQRQMLKESAQALLAEVQTAASAVRQAVLDKLA